jgi:hypothetical protein
MESFIAAANSDMQAEVKIPEINLTAFDQQAPYVTRRDQTSTVCPVPVLKPSTTRTAKMTVTDLNFIDLGSLYFTFRIRNNAAGGTVLRPLSAIPHCWFRRMRWMLNGTVLEDISHLSRIEEQISRFVSTNKRRNYGDVGSGWETLTDAGIDALPKAIDGQHSKKVAWRPLSSGWLQCGKYIPLLGGSAGGLSCEMELSDATDAVLNGAGMSTDWQIEEFEMHVDSVTMATELASQMAEQLIHDSILIPFQSNACDVQYLPAGSNNVTLSLAKQYSRLNSVIVSFADEIPATAPTNDAVGVHSKLMNRFYLAGGSKEQVSSFLQLNNQRYPQHDTVGAQQHMIKLQQGLGVYNSVSHSVAFSQDAYGGSDAGADARYFTIMTDTEMVPHVSASGQPVLGGGVIQFTAKNLGAPRMAFIMTQFDAVCEIRNQGCALYT